MTQITINSVTGFFPPFSGYVCNSYGNDCYFFGEINTLPDVITLPSQFDLVPVIGLKLIDSIGCEKFEVVVCSGEIKIPKQFQNGEDFFFMNLEIYQFQN